jgi:predicted HAD superfamily Cof-like phosphohydrolase
MKSQLKAVENFHVTFGQKINSYPTLLNVDEYLLRHRLMEEENSEYKEACENQSIVGIADALGDQLYILCGTILKHGLQHVIEDVFDEIQASNMSKLGPDGKPLLREDGKILKSANYRPPNIGKFL